MKSFKKDQFEFKVMAGENGFLIMHNDPTINPGMIRRFWVARAADELGVLMTELAYRIQNDEEKD